MNRHQPKQIEVTSLSYKGAAPVEVTVLLVPNDAETYLSVKRGQGIRRMRVVAHTDDGRDLLDVDVWTSNGWTQVLRDLDGTVADSIEEAAAVAVHVIGS